MRLGRGVLLQGLSVGLWLSICAPSYIIGGAVANPAPSVATELRKPAPDPHARLYEKRFEALVKARFPRLFTEPAHGTPVVTVLFDHQGRVLRADLAISSKSQSELVASETDFSRYGALAADLQYFGASVVHLPANSVLVVFAGSRDVDRALVQRYFPHVFEKGKPLSDSIRILLDHEGRVLRTGREQLKAERLRGILEKRYPGIRTSSMTATAVVGQDGSAVKNILGAPLQLYCVWLAVDSPSPQ
jgi:hypothetical protein